MTRRLILILALCCLPFVGMAGEVYTNGAMYVSHATNIKYQVVSVGQQTKTNELVLGRTYSFSTELFEFKTDVDPVELFFSNGTLARVNPKSEFVLNNFQQVVNNLDAEPEPLKAEQDNLGVSLMEGSMDILSLSTTNTPITFQTPLSTFGISKGKYHFEVDKNKERVVVYVLEGKLVVYDNITAKEEIVPQGKAVVVFPMPQLGNGKFVSTTQSDRMVTDVKKIRETEFKQMLDKANSLETIRSQVKFIVVDGKIVGVKIS